MTPTAKPEAVPRSAGRGCATSSGAAQTAVRGTDRLPVPAVTVADATFRVRDRRLLPGTTWRILRGQNWAVVGPNGSGKTTLVRALMGEVAVVKGTVTRHLPGPPNRTIGYVSFELLRSLMDAEDRLDASRSFAGDPDGRTTAGQIIRKAAADAGHGGRSFDWPVRWFGIGDLMDRGIRQLSTGQVRLVLIARALAKSPSLLILDEPFDGLDPSARRRLDRALGRVIEAGVQIVLVTHRAEELHPGITHVLELGRNRVVAQGAVERWDRRPLSHEPVSRVPGVEALPGPPVESRDILVRMRDVTVRYDGVCALHRLNWTVKRGENWAVVGPNGSGKTTLLNLISADVPQAYANDIVLFGRRRGTGESIWDIKRRIGLVGSEFHLRYGKSITAREAVLSGFFDSVGLFRAADRAQTATAEAWMDVLGIDHLRQRHLDRLSCGQQRLVLVARAMVKSPELLLLDEPCQGLDAANRQKVLDMIDVIGSRTPTRVVYVTHHADERLPCIHRTLRLPLAPGRETAGHPARHRVDPCP